MCNEGSITSTLNNIKVLKRFWSTKNGKLTYARIYNIIIKLMYLFINDEKLNRKLYKIKKHADINLKEPKTFSEKVLFLKLYYRNPLITLCADKYYVREYVKACGYEDILKETYGVFRDANELDFSSMPDKFFLKCNHISKYNLYVENKEKVDIVYLRKLYKILLKRNYYFAVREWSYKNISPLIICEECIMDSQGNLPIDYKFYCFGGEPKYFMISYGEYNHESKNHKFDMNFNSIDLKFKSKSNIDYKIIKKPINFDKMIEIARTLSKPFPHVRVDLYDIEGKIYFGELTFYSNGGFINVSSHEMDLTIGSWINLENYAKDMIKLPNDSLYK